MVRLALTLRARKGALFSIIPEYGMATYDMVNCFVQLIACFAFYPGNSSLGNALRSTQYYESGCIVFCVTAIIGALLAFHSLVEALLESRKFVFDTKEEKAKQQEWIEHVTFFLANACFGAGSVFFYPEVYEQDERNDLTWGTALFLAGSLLFCFASFVNALGMTNVGNLQSQPFDKKVAIFSLLLTNFGGVAFSMGSVLFFPELAPQDTAAEWDLLVIGTHLYVAGSVLFTVSAILSFLHACLKHRVKAPPEKAEGKLVDVAV